jgi:hypothetical protein
MSLCFISYRGLGNASAFLYVVLTDCILEDLSIEMDELFCDPFAGTTERSLFGFGN